MFIAFDKPNFLLPAWSVADDKIIYGKKEILISDIIELKHDVFPNGNGALRIRTKDSLEKIDLCYLSRQSSSVQIAEKHISEKMHSPKKEYRMRCNVCGKVFCFKVNSQVYYLKVVPLLWWI